MEQPTTFRQQLDTTVIQRFRHGDMAAFEAVYRAFERPAYTLALRLTAHPDVAHEILQAALLKAYEHARQYRGDAPFGAWLKQLVVNEALMHLRRERGRRSEPYEDVHIDEHASQPWRLADAATLERALSRLPDTARAVLWLYHVEGYTHVEIAAQFGRSVSFSKSRLARATRRLRQLLEPPVEDSPCPIGTTTTA